MLRSTIRNNTRGRVGEEDDNEYDNDPRARLGRQPSPLLDRRADWGRGRGRGRPLLDRGVEASGENIVFKTERAIFRGIASGIGLASEAIHRQKEKKALKKAEQNDREGASSTSSAEDEQLQNDAYLRVDEAAWELDDAQQQVMREEDSPPPGTLPSQSISDDQVSQLAETFLHNHPAIPYSPSTITTIDPQSASAEPSSSSSSRLALPVVITQRRPGKRSRGFVRAYAPILDDAAGIDEATFLEFLDDLNKAAEPSPWIQALNLASLAGMAAPEPVSVLISIAIQAATQVGDSLHSRFKTNRFVDRMNAEFFLPRGLVALITTWKPTAPDEYVTAVDFDDAVAGAAAGGREGEDAGKLQRLQRTFASSNVTSSFEFPETAPLTFPVLDSLVAAQQAADDDGEGKKKNNKNKKPNKVRSAGVFVNEYMDKRARAEWMGKNPDSRMASAGPKEVFHSRYADPNHPASSGDPIALLTGGYLQHPLGAYRGTSNRQVGSSSRPVARAGGLGGGLGGILPIKKVFEKDILYLMILPLPSEQQLATASSFVPDLPEPA